jgi:hypothetical protein
MKMSISFSPDLARIMAEETKAAERAVTLGVTQAGERLKSDWRAQITGAGWGQGWPAPSVRHAIQSMATASGRLPWSGQKPRRSSVRMTRVR